MENYTYYSKNPLKISKRQLNKKMKIYTSNDDITRYFGQGYDKDIIKYSELSNYKNIDQLLPGQYNSKIILLEDKLNSGHWVAIIKYDNTIEYFNSYALFPSAELDGNTYLKNKQLDQDTKYLNQLFTKALDKYRIIYNKKQFQKFDPNIATCGRWCILRILMAREGLNLKEFIAFINDLTMKFKLSGDQLVTLLVDKHSD